MDKSDFRITEGIEALKAAKMTGGEALNACYRDAFLVHAALTEITIDFGSLNRRTLDGQASARERLVMSPSVAMSLMRSLQVALDAVQETVIKMAKANPNILGGEND